LINDKLRLTLLHSTKALRTPGFSVGEWWQSHKDARRQAKGHWIKLARNPVVCCGSYKENEKVTWAKIFAATFYKPTSLQFELTQFISTFRKRRSSNSQVMLLFCWASYV